MRSNLNRKIEVIAEQLSIYLSMIAHQIALMPLLLLLLEKMVMGVQDHAQDECILLPKAYLQATRKMFFQKRQQSIPHE